MFLNEALTRLKNLKSKAARTLGYINDSAVHYEDEVPQYDYESEVMALRSLNEEILMLKTAIQITNASTEVTFRNQQVTLSELILRNAGVRAELAFVASQMAHNANETSRWSGERTKDHLKKIYAKGCDKVLFKQTLDSLEKFKEEIEAALATANSTTPLIGS